MSRSDRRAPVAPPDELFWHLSRPLFEGYVGTLELWPVGCHPDRNGFESLPHSKSTPAFPKGYPHGAVVSAPLWRPENVRRVSKRLVKRFRRGQTASLRLALAQALIEKGNVR